MVLLKVEMLYPEAVYFNLAPVSAGDNHTSRVTWPAPRISTQRMSRSTIRRRG